MSNNCGNKNNIMKSYCLNASKQVVLQYRERKDLYFVNRPLEKIRLIKSSNSKDRWEPGSDNLAEKNDECEINDNNPTQKSTKLLHYSTYNSCS